MLNDTIDYGALFGVDLSQGEAPGEEQTEQEGANEQENAEPAATVETADAETMGEPTGGSAAENVTAGDAMPVEERSKYAAARRKAEEERDAAIAEAKRLSEEEGARRLAAALAPLGLKDPTGKPISTYEELEAYNIRKAQEERERLRRKTGMESEEFDRFVHSLPEVAAAKAAQQKAEEARRSAQEQQMRAEVDRQMQEIRAIDPSIRDLQDITRMETYPRFRELVQRGNNFLDAFRLANFDALSRQSAAAQRQAALNAQSKQHLTSTAQRGTGAVEVPADVKASYKSFMPDATDADIQKHYNHYLKSKQ